MTETIDDLPELNVALVGYGMAGKVFHAPLIEATSGLVLRTVVSSDPHKVTVDLPDVRVVGALNTALKDDTIDLVVIATPDHLHTEQALAALDAGKHVVIDKPFATNLDDAQKVAARAAECGRTLTIFQNRRWDADFLTIKKLIAEGTFGEIVQFESHFDRLRPVVATQWKDRREAGLWQDLGPHLVDQALHLFGMPDAVFADISTQRQNAQAPDYAHVLLRYPKLRVILHMTQCTHASGLRFAIHGMRGSYIKHGLDVQEDQSKQGIKPDHPNWGTDTNAGVLTTLANNGAFQEKTIINERGNSPAFYAGVRDTLLGRRENPVLPKEALNVMTILDAGRISTAERREIALST
jgi:predicted dehydrogenase